MTKRWRGFVQFAPRYLWIGAYWKFERLASGNYREGYYVHNDPPWLLTVWICIVPCFPLVWQVRVGSPRVRKTTP